jgi:hypothetical protein
MTWTGEERRGEVSQTAMYSAWSHKQAERQTRPTTDSHIDKHTDRQQAHSVDIKNISIFLCLFYVLNVA